MHFPISRFLISAAALSGGGCLLAASPQLVQPMLVEADRLPAVTARTRECGAETLRLDDAAAAVARLPGASVVRNGPQTGILQVRGLSGQRVGIRVDGMQITPACPNHMDPPLHYADMAEGARLDLLAGVSPVSAGGDSLGSSLSVTRPAPEFATDGGTLSGGTMGTSYAGDRDTVRMTGGLRHASATTFVEYTGAAATAGDLSVPGGKVRASGYDMTRHGLRTAWQTADGYLEVDSGWSATRDAGTPALAMDMVRADAWNLGLRQHESFAWGTVQQRLYLHDIDHLMDNYSVRPVTGMRMQAPSTSRDIGWLAGVQLDRGADTLRFGLDLHHNEFDATQVATDSGMWRDMFHDNVRNRYGAYADWQHAWSGNSLTRIGIRGDLVTTEAAAVANQIMPMGAVLADQLAFNAADRTAADMLVDMVATWRVTPDEWSAWEMGVALKNRAPSLIERYLWTPLGSSAGMADGRNYLGDPALDPETSYQVSLGHTRRGECWDVTLTPFYQSVSDYIQGMPIARNDAMGRPVLQFSHIDRAELYGCEIDGSYRITPEWSVEAAASCVRGRDRQTGGDLYRIAPLHGVVDVAWQLDRWECHLESEWAAAQDHVAAIQGEPRSPGYGLLHLRAAHRFDNQLRVEVGIENLLNKRYADHLGGVNRVTGSDVAVGARLPGAGRFAYLALSQRF